MTTVSYIEKPKISNVNNKIIVPEKRNNDKNSFVSTYENHAHIVIGSRNAGKTRYLLKKLKKKDNKRPIHKITRFSNKILIKKQVTKINQ